MVKILSNEFMKNWDNLLPLCCLIRVGSYNVHNVPFSSQLITAILLHSVFNAAVCTLSHGIDPGEGVSKTQGNIF